MGGGGHVSDKHLTENCGLLNKLLPGDIVLAGRGLDIADSVGFYQATLKIHAFTCGVKVLSKHILICYRNYNILWYGPFDF